MYSDLPPPPPEQPVVFHEDPVIDTMDRVHALESAFLVLAVSLLEADVISVDHLQGQLGEIATTFDGPDGLSEQRPVGAYLDQFVAEISRVLRTRRQSPRPSGIRYQEWQERRDAFEKEQAARAAKR